MTAIEYKVTRESLARAEGYIQKMFWKRPPMKTYGMLITAFNILVWVFVGLLWVHHRSNYGVTASYWLAGTIAAVILGYGLYRLILTKIITLIPDEDGPRIGAQTLTFHNDGFEFSCGTVKSQAAYSDIKAIEKDSEFYYLIVDASTVFYVPRNAFRTKEILSAFISQVESGT